MNVFQRGTKVLQYETMQEFLRDFTFQKKNYILTSHSICETFFHGSTGGASIAFHNDYDQEEPGGRILNAMLKDIRGKQPERIIAIGGSVIDCAELFILEGTAGAEDMFLHRCIPEKNRELIAIPTTRGSGSEISRISIYELASLCTKLGLAVDTLCPDQAILTPELLSRLPFFYFVTSGVDALIRTNESFVSPKSNAYTHVFSAEAIRLLLHGFQIITRGGEDARMRLLGNFIQASNLAGIASGSTGTGAIYALGYPLSGICHIAHGEANYRFFTAIFQTYKAQERYSVYDIKKLFSEALSCSMEDAFTCMGALFSTFLAQRLLHEYGVKKSEIKGFTDSVIESQQRLLSDSVVSLSRDEIHSIYKALFWLCWNR